MIARNPIFDQTIKALAGWMSVKMLETYSHTHIEDKRAAVLTLDKKLSTNTDTRN